MNLVYTQRFIDRVKAQTPNSTELVMSSSDARGLHAELTKLLAELYSAQQSTPTQQPGQSAQTVDLDGGSF